MSINIAWFPDYGHLMATIFYIVVVVLLFVDYYQLLVILGSLGSVIAVKVRILNSWGVVVEVRWYGMRRNLHAKPNLG